MFGERLRRAQAIACRRYARQVAPYLLWPQSRRMPADFDPYRRQVRDSVFRWIKPVGFYRKFNGAHGRWCCTRDHLKMKGWRKRRYMFLRQIDEQGFRPGSP